MSARGIFISLTDDKLHTCAGVGCGLVAEPIFGGK
jgi:hypothetical protein